MLKRHKTAIMYTMIVLLVLVGPLIYFTSWGQGQVADYVAKNISEPWAPAWQERVGNTHFMLGRYPEAEKAYQDWMLYWPWDPRKPDSKYPEIYLKWAMSLEENHKKDEAGAAFQNFCEWWPDHPKINDAKAGVMRARNWR